MDFLFAPLPETNFQMNTEELRLWQRNAIFECECDNFINRRIESGQMGRPFFELSAINSAIQTQGLRLPGIYANREHHSNDDNNDDDDSHTDANANLTPPLRRRRLMASDPEQDRGNMLDRIYQEALYTAFRTRGLSAIRSPYY
ncbi:uncharacterized protein [Eurosta solidaginis]|uniref:uncharacterized protein n=1 Tax=Eurosta solidaginis TaxID=178769 RepID=UPI0035312018